MSKSHAASGSAVLYVGTHRRAHRADPDDIAFGVYRLGLDEDSGTFRALDMVETPQPGWIAAHPGGQFLYVVNEVRDFEGSEGGGVSAFRIDPDTGALSPLGSQRTPPLPCHCEVDSSGRWLLAATFGGGTVHLFPLGPDGRIGPQAEVHRHTGSSVHPRRQTQPHAHAVSFDPAGRFVLVPDLGTDQLRVYAFDADRGSLTPRPERTARLAPGSGPRHVAFDAHARFVYLMNEMNATITTFAYNPADGALEQRQSVDLLPEGFAGLRSGAELRVHPNGRFLYATTRSHGSSGEPPVRGLDSLVWFAIDPESGLLALRGRTASGGELPRSFTFDAPGERLFIGHQASASIVTFNIDLQTGTPIPSGERAAAPVPVCLVFSSRN